MKTSITIILAHGRWSTHVHEASIGHQDEIVNAAGSLSSGNHRYARLHHCNRIHCGALYWS